LHFALLWRKVTIFSGKNINFASKILRNEVFINYDLPLGSIFLVRQ